MQKLFIIAAIIFGIACNKKTVDETGFTVTADKEKYATTDTVRFSFTGNPWYLTFYSGEPYHNFEYRDRVTASGTPQLQFTSYMQSGTQKNTLRLLISTNFSGIYDSTNIYQAIWTDITDKIKLSGGSDNTPSGVADLSAFINDNPVYLAFKYTGAAGSTQRTWTIKSVALNNVLKDSTSYSVLGIAESSLGFRSVPMKAPGVAWTVSSSQLQIKGATGTTSTEAEGWVVSKPLNLTKVTPDTGVPLKNMTTALLFYNYIYETAGNYKATFVASNINRYDDKNNIEEVSITVQ